MSHLKLEVGKTYITNAFDEEDPNDGDVVQIVSIVFPETIEFERGMRFVAHNGELYTEDGISSDMINDLDFDGRIDYLSYEDIKSIRNTDTFGVVREAHSEDLKKAQEEFARISLDECEASPAFIKFDHPDFYMGLCQTYVDRRGMYKFINKVYRFNDTSIWGPDGGSRFMAGRDGYTASGKESDGRLSMFDIIYKRI